MSSSRSDSKNKFRPHRRIVVSLGLIADELKDKKPDVFSEIELYKKILHSSSNNPEKILDTIDKLIILCSSPQFNKDRVKKFVKALQKFKEKIINITLFKDSQLRSISNLKKKFHDEQERIILGNFNLQLNLLAKDRQDICLQLDEIVKEAGIKPTHKKIYSGTHFPAISAAKPKSKVSRPAGAGSSATTLAPIGKQNISTDDKHPHHRKKSSTSIFKNKVKKDPVPAESSDEFRKRIRSRRHSSSNSS